MLQSDLRNVGILLRVQIITSSVLNFSMQLDKERVCFARFWERVKSSRNRADSTFIEYSLNFRNAVAASPFWKLRVWFKIFENKQEFTLEEKSIFYAKTTTLSYALLLQIGDYICTNKEYDRVKVCSISSILTPTLIF